MSHSRDAIITQAKRPDATAVPVSSVVKPEQPPTDSFHRSSEQEVSVKYGRVEESLEIHGIPATPIEQKPNNLSTNEKLSSKKSKRPSPVCNFFRNVFSCCRSPKEIIPNASTEDARGGIAQNSTELSPTPRIGAAVGVDAKKPTPTTPSAAAGQPNAIYDNNASNCVSPDQIKIMTDQTSAEQVDQSYSAESRQHADESTNLLPQLGTYNFPANGEVLANETFTLPLNDSYEDRESYHSGGTSRRQSSMESLELDREAQDSVMSEDVEEYEGHYLGDVAPSDEGKICLVIDLDETLVHSSFDKVSCDFIVEVEIDGELHPVYVCKRPHVDQFLQTVESLFECVLFTASLSRYADPVTDELDPQKSIFRHRLFRESCHYYQGNYVKNLDDLGRPIERTVILDNSPVCYCFHPHNAIPISTWFDDPDDTALLQLCEYMERMSSATDVVAFLEANAPPGLELLSEHDREMVSGVGNTVFSRPINTS